VKRVTRSIGPVAVGVAVVALSACSAGSPGTTSLGAASESVSRAPYPGPGTASSAASAAAVTRPPVAATATASGPAVTLVAAGDIACDPGSGHFNGGQGDGRDCRQLATAELVASLKPDVVAVLGDDQYEDGTLEAFQTSYDPSWGRVKAITRPAVGNHEYGTAGAAGYFTYFGAAAGTPGQGWYSYDLGAWHVVVLNSNCDEVGGCDAGSPQLAWLTADLAADRAAHPQGCLLAYWHHPLWSHGEYRGIKAVRPFMQALYDAGADVVLNGHDHNYERYAPRDPAGQADPARGVREFVVGTGGKSHYSVSGDPGIEASNDGTYGVLQLRLRPVGYDWSFRPAAGGTFSDAGAATCHRSAG